MAEVDTPQSIVTVNSVVWITSLREHEVGVTTRILEDLEPFLSSKKVHFELHSPKTAAEFLYCLDELAIKAQKGLSPIIHLDTHGSEDAGVHIAASREDVSWRDVVEKFRRINTATSNNLCVVSMACFSFRAVMEIDITSQAPFYLLAAPPDEVKAEFVEKTANAFYEGVFEGTDLVGAFKTVLAGEMQLMHAEELLFISLAKYIRAGCIGKAARERAEELLTAGLRRLEGAPDRKRLFRKIIREKIKPSKDMLDRYVDSFLLGKAVPFDIEKVVAHARTLPDPYKGGKRGRPSVEENLRGM